jgi:hypothetical protein
VASRFRPDQASSAAAYAAHWGTRVPQVPNPGVWTPESGANDERRGEQMLRRLHDDRPHGHIQGREDQA